MKKQILIKICGIKTPELAFDVANIGAKFIGMVFHPESKRFVDPQVAKKICQAAEKGGAKAVGVFVNHNAVDMFDICEATGIQIVQLHGAIAKNDAYKLPQTIRRICVVNVDYDGTILDDKDKKNIALLDQQRDFLLFDGNNPGSGEVFNLSQFKYHYKLPFFLAGGLNAINIEEAIRVIKPDCVDVSSGVENKNGIKDVELIEQFISLVSNLEDKL